MISEEILNKVCPVPNEEEEMEKIRQELSDDGFKINNFNKGGIFYIIIRIFVAIYIELKELGRSIINNLFVLHADEDWLEVKAGDFGKSRVEAVKTRGYVTLYRDEYENALQVTKGHMFKTLPDVNGKELKFYAVETTVIGAGERTGNVLVEAEESGTRYNVSSGRITTSMIHLEGVQSVSNKDGWIEKEGTDIEEVEHFRERILESWSEVSELPIDDKIKNIAKKVSGVLDVQLDSQHPRGQGTLDIIITGTNGEATQKLLDDVREATKHLQGNNDDFLCKSSVVSRKKVALTLYIAKDVSTEGVKEQAEAVIENVWKLQNRTELNCMYIDDMRYALKSAIPNYKSTVFSSPTEDIEMGTGNVVMLDSVSVTVLNKGGN